MRNTKVVLITILMPYGEDSSNMLKMITVIFCVLVLRVRGQYVDQPSAFKNEEHANHFLDIHLINMTRAFCKGENIEMYAEEVLIKNDGLHSGSAGRSENSRRRHTFSPRRRKRGGYSLSYSTPAVYSPSVLRIFDQVTCPDASLTFFTHYTHYKNSTLKLRMAEVVQTTYQSTKGYELGTIASSLMEKYRIMIRIYRYYSAAKKFRNYDHSMQDILDGYSNMQGTYNEIVTETELYHKVLDYHLRKDAREFSEAKALSKKYKISAKALLDLKRRGIKLSDIGIHRRSMQTDTKLPVKVGKLPEDYRPRDLLLEDPMAKNINIWSPKKNNNSQEEEYKKKLRYIKWAESWKGYDGETEGVHIADAIARLPVNDSDFLMKELKGVV